MGWFSRLSGPSRPAPQLHIDPEREETMRRQEQELAMALNRNTRAVRTAYDDLARGVLAEVMMGKRQQ